MVKLGKLDFSKKGLEKFLSPIELKILEYLWEKGKVTTIDLANHLKLSQSSVGGTIDRLLRYGCVKRERIPGSIRPKYIYMTTMTADLLLKKIFFTMMMSLEEDFGSEKIKSLVDEYYSLDPTKRKEITESDECHTD